MTARWTGGRGIGVRFPIRRLSLELKGRCVKLITQPPSSTEVENTWRYTSTPPHCVVLNLVQGHLHIWTPKILDILMKVSVQIAIFWVMTPSILEAGHQHLGGACCLFVSVEIFLRNVGTHVQDYMVSQPRHIWTWMWWSGRGQHCNRRTRRLDSTASRSSSIQVPTPQPLFPVLPSVLFPHKNCVRIYLPVSSHTTGPFQSPRI